MTTILLAIIIFGNILTRLIIFDIILSWMTLLGLKFRPAFLASVIDPLYKKVRELIPTRIGAFDLTPIIIFILILFIEGLLSLLFPESYNEVKILLSSVNF